MSGPVLGVPVGPDPRQAHRGRTFDHIPHLRELMSYGGWPGIVYAQVCVHNLANAIERDTEPAHLRQIRGCEYYEIAGPRGVAQMALVGCGTPIPGASPDGGARLFFTDGEVERLTGLPVKDVIWLRPQPPESKAAEPAPEATAVPVTTAAAPPPAEPRADLPKNPGQRPPSRDAAKS